MEKWILSYIFLRCITLTVSVNVYDGVANGGVSSNPGVKVRITQKGLNYLNEILLYEMNTIIPRLHLDDSEHSQGNGHLKITNGRVTGYKPPRSQTLNLQPPDRVVWASSGADIAMAGHVQGSYGRFHEEGDVDILAKDVNFIISIHPLAQPNGQFGLKCINCQASIGWMDFNIHNTGMLGKMLQTNKGQIIRRLSPRVGKQLCDHAVKMIDQGANNQLAQIPTKVPLNDAAGAIRHSISDDRSSSVNRKKDKHMDDKEFDTPSDPDAGDKRSEGYKELTKNITKHLTFDYSNTRDPSVMSKFIETYNKGEISYHAQGGCPFSPAQTHEPNQPTEKMAYVVASDYVCNSMLYSAFTHNLLKTEISARKTPDFKEYLRTSCNSDDLLELCLGSIIPEMQDSFPDSQAEIESEATEISPAVFFQRDGIMDIMGQALVKLYAAKNGQRKTMAIAHVDMNAKAKLYLSNDQKVKGNCTIDKYNVTMRENNLKGFDEERKQEFSTQSRFMMQEIVNAYLRQGIKLPEVKAVKLRNTKLNIFDRTVRIDTDLEADKETLTHMAVAQIQKHGGRVDGY